MANLGTIGTHSTLAGEAAQRAPVALQAQSGKNDSPYLASRGNRNVPPTGKADHSLIPNLARRAWPNIGVARPSIGQIWPRHKKR